MLGRFLEISLHAPDIIRSLGFYEGLGFTQAPVGEIWQHPYAVVTDGRLFIGLHGYEFQSPALTFVQPDLEHHVTALERAGHAFAFKRVGGEVFNEAGLLDPGGQMVALLEARTFSPPERRSHQTSRLGWFEQVVLPVKDLDASVAFWEGLGFVPAEESEQPFPHIGLTSDSLNVALMRSRGLGQAGLMFRDAGMPERIRQLAEADIGFSAELPAGLDPARYALLVAPEGTPLLLATGDE